MAVVEDICDHKQTAARLEQQALWLDKFFLLTPDMLCTANEEGYLTQVNPAWQKILGWTPQQLTTRPYLEFVHPDDRDSTIKAGRALIEESTVIDFSNRYRTTDGSWRWLEWHSVGAEGTIFAAARDITERLEFEHQLSLSTGRLRALIENAPLGAHEYELTEQGALVFSGFNQTASRILGIDCATLIGKTIEEAFPPLAQTPIPQAYRKVAQSGERYEDEQISYSYGHISGAYDISAFQTAPSRMAVLFRDITENKKAELALRASEEHYRALFENMTQGVYYQSAEGKITDCNPALLRLFGISREQFVGKSVATLHWRAITQQGSVLTYEQMAATLALQHGAIIRNRITGIFSPPRNRWIWLSITAIPQFRPQQNHPYQVVVTLHDITESKRAEDKTKHINQVLLAIRDINQLITKQKQPEALLQGACAHLVNTSGYRYAFMYLLDTQDHPSFQAHSGTSAFVAPLREQLDKESMPPWLQQALLRPGVTLHPCSTTAPLQPQDENNEDVVWAVIALKQGGHHYGFLLVETAPCYANDAQERSLLQEVAGDLGFALHDIELTRRHEQAQEELRIYANRLQSIFRVAPAGIGIVKDRIILEVNPSVSAIVGYEQQELVGKNTRMLYDSQQEYERVGQQLYPHFDNPHFDNPHFDNPHFDNPHFDNPHLDNPTIGRAEALWRRKDGRIINVLLDLAPFDSATPAKGLTFTVLDITERKRAEQALAASEARYKLLFEKSGAGTAEIDSRSGTFIMVNRRFCDMLGYSAQELLSTNFQSITHPDDIANDVGHMQQLVAGEIDGFTIEKRYCRKDGTMLWAILTIAPLWQKGESPSHHIAIAQDITALKSTQQQLFASLREKETLLQELYHRTKNNMQVISSLLAMQAETSGEQGVRRLIFDAVNRIKAMALVHQKLYESKNLSHVDLAEYLAELAHMLMRNASPSPQSISLNLQLQPCQVLIDIAIPLGLVANELITNSLLHAFPHGRSGTISITLQPVRTILKLMICDNGIGMAQPFDLQRSNNLGLSLVNNIITRQLQGQLILLPGAGTQWQISVRGDLYDERV
jgi:PAS domain S-box-containing protein